MSYETATQCSMFNMVGSRLSNSNDIDDTKEDWLTNSDDNPFSFPLEFPDVIKIMFKEREFLMRESGKDFRFDARAWHEYLLTAPDKGHGYRFCRKVSLGFYIALNLPYVFQKIHRQDTPSMSIAE